MGGDKKETWYNKNMNGIFSESTLGVISKIKKGFLWSAVCLLIGGFVLGALLIVMGTFNTEMGKILATMAILALVLFVGVNNFIRMEKGTKAIQILALIGLIAGLLAAILGILLVWEVLPSYDISAYTCTSSRNNPDYCRLMGIGRDVITPSVWAKILSILSSIASAGFWISNVMSIKETIKVVKPLKITSVVCEAYCAIYAVVFVFIYSEVNSFEVMSRMSALSGLAGFAFVVTALAALIISKTSGKKQTTASEAVVTPKTDEELRAEIEEKVRREMIEKEVRAKMGAEDDTSQEQKPSNDGPESTGLSSDGQF